MPISEQIRQALIASGHSRYRVSKDLDISQAQLSRFVNCKGQLSVEVLDRLADYLGLEVRGKADRPAGKSPTRKPAAKKRSR